MKTRYLGIPESKGNHITKKLEELLNLPPIEEVEVEMPEEDPEHTKEQALEEAAAVMTAMSASEKVDIALTTVTGLLEHDHEMDDIAKKAMSSYTDLCDLGQNVPDMHVGKIYEVASSMLKTAMEAKDAKVQKKLKMLDLQIKKMKIDNDVNPEAAGGGTGGSEFDRNELLRHIVDASKTDETDK